VRESTAEVLARLTGGWMDGQPAVCRNAFGKGHAYYVTTRPDPEYLSTLLREACAELGVHPLVEAPFGVEAMLRSGNEACYLFVINHTDRPAYVQLCAGNGVDVLTGERCEGDLHLDPYGVRILSVSASITD
jgi:beta-galactosidase